MLLLMAFSIILPPYAKAIPPVGYVEGEIVEIPGTYYLESGAKSGLTMYHIRGNLNGLPADSFWEDTFCTHKDYSSAPGSYVFYYNAVPADETNTTLLETILNIGTPYKTGIEMSLNDYRHLRYSMLYTNINRDTNGQAAYWTYLGKFLPERYSFFNYNRVGDWQDAWMTQYFGGKQTADFYGLGPIEDGETVSIGAKVDTFISRPANEAGLHDLDGAGNVIVGPYSIHWTSDSDPALAQLNSGANKEIPPSFSLYETSGAHVRFYKGSSGAPDLSRPITSASIGEEFYVVYNKTKSNLAAANNGGAGSTVNIEVKSNHPIISEVLGDMFFIHPNAQNQLNVDYAQTTAQYSISLQYKSATKPKVPQSEDDYFRPAVEKEVAEDNHTDNTGNYADVLSVIPGTDVLHKITINSEDSKGTILTFENRDYDLYASDLFDTLGATPEDTSVITADDAAALKAAIGANKNIKLGSNIHIPSDWAPSATIYSGIFDGNGYQLIGTTGMTAPIFNETLDAVFYRVQFVGFAMTRVLGTESSVYFGALVNNFNSTEGAEKGELINCYVQGKLTLTNEYISGDFPRVGLVAGSVRANRVYGVKALGDVAELASTGKNEDYFLSPFIGNANVVKDFENNEVLPGSSLASRTYYLSGLTSLSKAGTEEIAVRNCRADYTLTVSDSPGGLNHYGGMFERIAGVYLIENCIVNVDKKNLQR
jgi:hypothetical protein